MATNFAGESKRNDIQEALTNAINLAKKSLQTDFITWKLTAITGEDGGVVQVHNMKVYIDAEVFKSGGEKK